jgi:hypothetical protein
VACSLTVGGSRAWARQSIGCAGNSITEASLSLYEALNIEVNEGGYPAYLETELGTDTYRVKNLGRISDLVGGS